MSDIHPTAIVAPGATVGDGVRIGPWCQVGPDVVLEASLKPYDFSAMLPVVEGAGGIASDWRGAPLTIASDGRVLVAGDCRVHQQALALLAG